MSAKPSARAVNDVPNATTEATWVRRGNPHAVIDLMRDVRKWANRASLAIDMSVQLGDARFDKIEEARRRLVEARFALEAALDEAMVLREELALARRMAQSLVKP